MGPREGGEEVIEGVFVGEVCCSETKSNLVPVAMQEVVFSKCEVKDISWGDSRWVAVVIRGVGPRDTDES